MSTELVFNNISRIINLTEAEKAIFAGHLHFKSLKRKEFLLRQDEICKYSAFVNSGCLRGYTIDKNGIEHVLSFAPPGWWMADLYSLFSEKPGTLNIEAIEAIYRSAKV
jgi:CRP-like cAMP-binding protein